METLATPATDDVVDDPARTVAEPQTVDEAPKLLIEELTIDGMCGVY